LSYQAVFRKTDGNEGGSVNKEILTMEEASELFGVSVKTFIKLLREEKVPARKIGREWRFSRKALIDWLSSGDSQTYSSSEAEARDFFNKVAPEWEEWRKVYYDESIKNRIFELNLLNEKMTVLDLGAGDGYISRSVAGFAKKVIAVDISGEMLKMLQIKAKEEGISNISILESDGQDVPLKDSSVDMIFANMYLHHIEEPEQAVSEMGRLLKADGKVFVADFFEHNNIELKERMHDIWPGFKPAKIKEWFKENGFDNLKIETVPERFENKESREREKVFIFTAVKR